MEQETNLLQQEIIRKTGFSMLPQSSLQLFREKLASVIHDLINHDFNKLILILYRLDINENKLKQKLANKTSDAGLLIADMIIMREQEKIETRKKYKQRSEDIPEKDKW